jgi:hypothetical protein
VFEDSGIYLGRLSLEETILTERPPPHITATHVYAVVEDELGIPFVVRYRIIRP